MSTLTYTYTSLPTGTTALGTQVMQNFNDVRTVINGLTQDNIATGAVDTDELASGAVTANKLDTAAVIEAKVDYASANAGVKVVRCGPNYPGAGGGHLIRIEVAKTFDTSTTQTITVDWSASSAKDGAVTFSATPTPSGITFRDTVAAMNTAWGARITAISATGCTVSVVFADAPTGGATICCFHVFGPVA